MKLEGVAAIVTGGASGLGAATAGELAVAGARVTVFDLDEAQGRRVAAEIGGAFVRVDVADEASVVAGLAATSASAGPARVMVNCAGSGGGGIRTAGPKGPHPLELFTRLLAVNLVGTFNCMRLGAAAMLELPPLADGERGVIVNTSSAAAEDGPVGMVAYSASKAAVNGMTLPAARDLAPAGIRVCGISPGVFETPMFDVPETLRSHLVEAQPFPRRFGDPAEFARLVRHICENVMLNGTTIRLDGALRLGQH